MWLNFVLYKVLYWFKMLLKLLYLFIIIISKSMVYDNEFMWFVWCDLFFSKIKLCNKLYCFSRNKGNKSNYFLLKFFLIFLSDFFFLICSYIFFLVLLRLFILFLKFEWYFVGIFWFGDFREVFERFVIWVKCVRIE